MKSRIAIAGASGFIGSRLCTHLCDKHEIIALSRSGKSMGVQGRKADLFSFEQTSVALECVQTAIYLVHSMSHPAQLTQANFADLDVIAADNFRRAAESAGVARIIYVSGLMDRTDEKLSRHLKSRFEVENVLSAGRPRLTTLRAGLVVGAGGSSFEMLLSLVRRLPAMICPKWTSTLSSPIAVSDLVRLIEFCIVDESTADRVFEVGGKDTITYREMMSTVARVLGVKRYFISVPFFSPELSKLWVRCVTGKPKELVHPLVESLKSPMVPSERSLESKAGLSPLGFEQALRIALEEEKRIRPLETPSLKTRRPSPHKVCSVQRLAVESGRDASWAAEEYFRWLKRFLRWLLRVECPVSDQWELYVHGIPNPVLVLKRERAISEGTYERFRIRSGLLVRAGDGLGHFEFRSIPEKNFVIAAIHDYEPRLWWVIYVLTQARVHLWIMRGFASHLVEGRAS
jgi:uncharacterized protein YbjT (DUF2867 family)